MWAEPDPYLGSVFMDGLDVRHAQTVPLLMFPGHLNLHPRPCGIIMGVVGLKSGVCCCLYEVPLFGGPCAVWGTHVILNPGTRVTAGI